MLFRLRQLVHDPFTSTQMLELCQRSLGRGVRRTVVDVIHTSHVAVDVEALLAAYAIHVLAVDTTQMSSVQ